MDAKGLGIIKIGCWLVISAPQKRKGKGVAGGGSHSQGPEGSLGSDRGTNRIAPATLAYQAVKSPFMHSISRYDRNIKSSFRPVALSSVVCCWERQPSNPSSDVRGISGDEQCSAER